MSTRTPEFLRGLVAELRALSSETGWVEFKTNNADAVNAGKIGPDDVGASKENMKYVPYWALSRES